jgi:TonB family protein
MNNTSQFAPNHRRVSPSSTSLSAAALIAVATLTACNKSDRIPTTEERLKAVQSKQESQPDFFIPRKQVDYTADLKSIREAPRADAAPKAEPAKPEPTKVAQAEPQRAAPTPLVPAQPAPQAAAPVQQAPVQQQPAPQPVQPAPTPAPAARAADTSVTVVNREAPSFPREAVRQGVESGSVRARATINAAGDVTAVTIVSARPPRIFDREVQQTLQRWKFNPGAEGRSYETEIAFQR